MVENFDEFYEEYFEARRDWYDRRASANRRRHRAIQGTKIGLAAFLPLAVSLFPVTGSVLWQVSILLASVALIGVECLGRAWRPQKKWLNYRTIAEGLRREEQMYRTTTGEYDDLNDTDGAFVERVLSLTDPEKRYWEINAPSEEGDTEA